MAFHGALVSGKRGQAKTAHAPFRAARRPKPERGAQPEGRALSATLRALLAAVVGLAAMGAFLAAQVVVPAARLEHPAGPPADPFAVGQSLHTSFGAIAVEHVDKLAGPTARDLGGMTHGIQGLVAPDQVQVQVSVRLTDRLDRAVDYAPSQFRLIVDQGDTPIPASGSTTQAGMLQPGWSIETTLSFVAPRDGSQLWLEYRDPGHDAPLVVDLGRTDQTPEGALDGFHHKGGDR